MEKQRISTIFLGICPIFAHFYRFLPVFGLSGLRSWP